jgi:hypothetical protein
LPTVDELWLGAFQRLCDATAHQFKGALNGVAINLEVVKSRTGRADGVGKGDVTALHPFAEAAAAELESVIRSAESMLALARPQRGPADVARIVRDVAWLSARAASARGARITVDPSVERVGMTIAPASAARLAVTAVLMSAIEGSEDVVCSAVPDVAAIRVTRGERDGSRIALDDEIVTAARSAGVHLDITESGATITFPI